jgi:hypothetical protein
MALGKRLHQGPSRGSGHGAHLTPSRAAPEVARSTPGSSWLEALDLVLALTPVEVLRLGGVAPVGGGHEPNGQIGPSLGISRRLVSQAGSG